MFREDVYCHLVRIDFFFICTFLVALHSFIAGHLGEARIRATNLSPPGGAQTSKMGEMGTSGGGAYKVDIQLTTVVVRDMKSVCCTLPLSSLWAS